MLDTDFFIFEAALVPFEITACNVIIHFWSEAVPTAAIISIVIILYALINLLAVKWYGESEFWAALGKVLLIIGLIVFTFIVMLGGNPQHDRFGFRYVRIPRDVNLAALLPFVMLVWFDYHLPCLGAGECPRFGCAICAAAPLRHVCSSSILPMC